MPTIKFISFFYLLCALCNKKCIIQCNLLRDLLNTVQCNKSAALGITVQFCALYKVQCSTVQFTASLCNAVQCRSVECSALQFSQPHNV